MEAFVYCWTDTLTGKLYVGSHKGSDSDGYVCSSKYMLAEYSNRPNDFVRTVLAHGKYQDVLKLETKILQSVDAAKSENYYNMHNNNGHYRSHSTKTEECKDKIRKKSIGRKRSVESKLKQSRSVSGSNNHFYGKKHDTCAIEKMSELKVGIYSGGKNPNATRVSYDGIIYDSKSEMTNATGLSLYTINKMITENKVSLA